MDLPDALLADIAGFTGLRFDGVKDDRRRNARLPCGKQSIIWPAAGERTPDATVVTIRDVSVGGISLDLPTALAAGTWFVALLPRRVGRPVKVRCVVQWCERAGKRHLAGALFKKLLDAAEPAAAQPAAPEFVP